MELTFQSLTFFRGKKNISFIISFTALIWRYSTLNLFDEIFRCPTNSVPKIEAFISCLNILGELTKDPNM